VEVGDTVTIRLEDGTEEAFVIVHEHRREAEPVRVADSLVESRLHGPP
jgi:hypothetical protein